MYSYESLKICADGEFIHFLRRMLNNIKKICRPMLIYKNKAIMSLLIAQ